MDHTSTISSLMDPFTDWIAFAEGLDPTRLSDDELAEVMRLNQKVVEQLEWVGLQLQGRLGAIAVLKAASAHQ